MQNSEQTKPALLRRGEIVFVALMILTGLEFWVAIAMNSLFLLALAAIPKAILVVEYYMHARRLGELEAGGD